MNKSRKDTIWQLTGVVQSYLGEVSEGVPDRARQLEVMLRLLGSLGRPVERLLDLGCGDGILTGAVLRRFPSVKAVLVDFSRPMLDAARARFAAGESPPRIIEGDLADPETWAVVSQAGPFDAVVSAFAIHHLTDAKKREVFGEIFELLRPGGLFINHEHVASPSKWIEQNWDELIIDHLWANRRAKGESVERGQVAEAYADRADKDANILAPVEAQCGWLRAIGYTDVDCYFKVFEIASFGGRRPAS